MLTSWSVEGRGSTHASAARVGSRSGHSLPEATSPSVAWPVMRRVPSAPAETARRPARSTSRTRA